MSIATIESEIETLANEVTDIEKVYDYPVLQLGRQLPALVIIYDGINQEKESKKQTETTYNFQFFLYYKAEGKTLEIVWNSLKDIVKDILDKFRDDPMLNSACWGSIISSGESIISEVKNNQLIGYRFTLEAIKIDT